MTTTQVLAAGRPRDLVLRCEGYESGIPVRIGENIIILPGITIGDDAIIGASSVVTRNAPPGATVMGNPAKALSRVDHRLRSGQCDYVSYNRAR